jgi:phospholipid/cholesterol/gamma-HCH transport system substrate-binding protein
MISKAQKIRAAIFFLLTTVLLVVFLFFIVGNTLFKKRDNYFITYSNVSVNGLQLGSAVKYYGINIGRVEDITFKRKNLNDVIVDISIKAGTPIKEDVKASLVGVGITGLKQIEITGGSDEAALLEPGSEIESGTSAISDITGKAEVIAEKSELLINRLNDLFDDTNREKVAGILKNTESLLASLNKVAIEKESEISDIITNMDTISVNLKNFVYNAELATARINKILMSDRIDTIIYNTEAFTDSLKQTRIKKLVNQELVNSINNLNLVLKQVSDTFTHIDLTVLKGREDLLQTLEELEEAAEYLREFSRQINENPSSLLRSRK